MSYSCPCRSCENSRNGITRICSTCNVRPSIWQWGFHGHDGLSAETYTDSCQECMRKSMDEIFPDNKESADFFMAVYDPKRYPENAQ